MSSRDILSQEEVDALLSHQESGNHQSSSDFRSGLTTQDKDVIGEIGNISMGTAATALFTILNKKVEITAPKVSMTTFAQLVREFDRPCILVEVEYISGVEGRNVLIIKQQDAVIIADLMMGGDGLNPPEELDEMHISAVGEAMNQMMGSAATSLSSIIERTVNISPPQTDLLTLNPTTIEEREFDPEEEVVKISFRMKIGNLVDSNIMQLAPIPFVKDLVDSLLDSTDEVIKEAEEETPLVNEVRQTAFDQNEEARVAQSLEQPAMETQYQQPVAMGVGVGAPSQQTWGSASYAEQQNVFSQQVNADKAVFPDFGDSLDTTTINQNIALIEDVPLQVAVQLGKTQMAIKDILELGSGSIIELDKLAGEPVDLFVNGKLIAKGEVVVIDENFGFRVKDIISPLERLKQAKN